MKFKKTKWWQEAKIHMYRGFWWAIGVTLGFAFLSVVAITLLSRIATIPVIGSFVADVVYETQVNLGKRNPRTLPTPN